MKHFNLTFAAIIAGGMLTLGNADAGAQNNQSNSTFKIFLSNKSESQVKRFLPQTIIRQAYDLDKKEWINSGEYKCKYEESGNLVECYEKSLNFDGNIDNNRYFRKYDEHNNAIEQIKQHLADDGVTYVNEQISLWEYDDVVTDYILREQLFKWDETLQDWDDYDILENYYTKITRDEQNRIISSEYFKVINDESVSQNRLVYEYEGDGHANKASLYYRGKDKPSKVWDNIVWKESTDNCPEIYHDYVHPFMYCEGNIPLSFTYLKSDNETGELKKVLDFEATYNDQDRILREVIKRVKEPYFEITDYIYTDDNGSFIKYIGECNNEQDFTDGNQVITEKEIRNFDDYGNTTLSETYMYDEGYEFFIAGNKFSYKYNDDGVIVDKIYEWYSPERSEYIYSGRTLYSDFMELAGTDIKAVSAEKDMMAEINGGTLNFINADGADYAVCDIMGRILMQGKVTDTKVSVNGLPNGMYIVKINNRTVKLIKK